MIIIDNQNKIPWTLNRANLAGNNLLLNPGSSAETLLETNEEIQIVIAGRKISGNGIFEINLLDHKQKVVFNEKVFFSSTLNNQKIIKIKAGLNIQKLVVLKTMAQFGRVELVRVQAKKVASLPAPNKTEKTYNTFLINDLPKRETNLAVIVPYPIFGGAEVYLKSIFQHLPVNFKSTFFFLKRNLLSNYLINSNILLDNVSSLQALQTKLINGNFDKIIYYNSLSIYNFLVSIKNKFNLKSKLIEIYHSDFKWSDSLSSVDYRTDINLIIKITENLCKNIDGVRQVTVPIPIDTNKFQLKKDSTKKKKYVFGMVARLSPEKDPLYAVELFRNLPHELWIAGDGPLRGQIQEKINGNNISNVKILGHLEDIEEFYKKIDAFILTSNNEGVPISILESMSVGLPIFTTDVGQIKNHLGMMDGIYFLEKNLEKDIQILNANFELLNQNLNEFIRDNHQQESVARKFFDSLDCHLSWNSYDKGSEIILSGEYI